LILLTFGGAAGGGLFLWDWLGASPYFRIEKIDVEGVNHLTEEAVVQYLEKSRNQSLLRVSLDAYRTRIESDPWVRTVRLKRHFPDRLEVRITEKKSLGYIREGGESYLLDEEGRFIGKEFTAIKTLPEIRGVQVAKWVRGDEREVRLVQRGVAFIQSAMRPNFLFAKEDLTAIRLQSEDDLEATIGGAAFLFRFPYPAQQWLRFLSVKNDILNRNIAIENIDLRYSGKVIVRPAKEKA
jgi:cell division septal protein FtsQ